MSRACPQPPRPVVSAIDQSPGPLPRFLEFAAAIGLVEAPRILRGWFLPGLAAAA
jgi:hypothetical protein